MPRRADLHIIQRGQGYTTRVNAKDAAGVRVQRRFSGETEDEVRALAYAWLAEMAAGVWRKPDETPVSEWMRAWYVTYRPTSPATRDERRVQMARIERHALGSVTLGRLTTADIEGWVAWMQDEGYQPGTIRNTAAVLGMALDLAVRRGLLPSSPLAHVTLPSRIEREWVILTERQARTLIDGTRGERLHAFWVLAVMLGMRRGELLALAWDAVDLERGELEVRRHISRRNGRYEIVSGAKTRSGRRSLVLPEPCIDALADEQRTQAARGYADSQVVFDDGAGEPWLSPGALWFVWREVVERLKLPERVTIHDLRHGAGSHMLANGVSLPDVSRILGHANPGITARLYAHVIERMSSTTAAKIGGMYGVGASAGTKAR